MAKGPDWSRPLPQPLVIPEVMTLRTLADVRELLGHIPKERREHSAIRRWLGPFHSLQLSAIIAVGRISVGARQQLSEELSMISIIRTITKLFVVLAALAPALFTSPAAALQRVAYISSTGNDANPCTAAQPCASFSQAYATVQNDGEITCLSPPDSENPIEAGEVNLIIDCPDGVWGNTNGTTITMVLSNTITLRHLTFNNAVSAIILTGSGTLILEDCIIQNNSGTALNINPAGALNLVITNTRISTSASGILINPASGGSVNASLDHVTITQNSGGGIKIESANGPVTVDIANSVISNNAGNGINAVAGANQDIVSIKNSIIAKNGTAGVQANGTNAGVLISNTLLDQNAAGALSVVGGGGIFTYGNNQVVGSQGSNFTSTVALK